jgi:hypothetical protein
MSELDDAVARLEQALARLEEASSRTRSIADDRQTAAVAASVARRIDAAIAKLDKLLEREA